MKRLILTVALMGFFSAVPLPTLADLPKDGSYDYTVCFTRKASRIEHSPSRFAYSYEESGTAVGKIPGSLFDGERVRCVGFTASIDDKRTGGSMCEGIAKNGDRRLTRFWYDEEGKLQRVQVAGTGVYDGFTTTGSVKTIGATEEIEPGTTRFCNQATGTYKLR